MSALKSFLDGELAGKHLELTKTEKVKVVTSDGRLFIGVLEGFDQSSNIVLSKSFERIFSPTEPTKDLELGSYLIRGEQIVIVGMLDDEEESQTDYDKIHGFQLKDTKNALR
ncbi:hypothetical protein KL918_004332 [Ogataea parapolymorpha]|nr:hypothetical protein KL918_004332 [Ogataea parapolymorpha]KAG7872028.1 hypothetical protein KL916_003366 [Ogataea parapolymorpha]